MPTPKVKGNRKVITKPVEYTFDPRNGETARIIKRCAGIGPLAGLYAAAKALGWRGRFLASPVMSELELESPEPINSNASEFITDTWQIVGNEIHKSIYETPFVNELFSSVLTDISDAIRTGGSRPASLTSAAEIQLWNEIVAGQDSVAAGQYVLKHTTNCSANSTNNVSDFNVECLYTTAQLLTEVTNTSLWVRTLPTRLYNKILSITTPTGIDEWHLWSWRKLPSTETLTPNNRIEINTEYWLDSWSILRYALAV